jgi:hypothetical protein
LGFFHSWFSPFPLNLLLTPHLDPVHVHKVYVTRNPSRNCSDLLMEWNKGLCVAFTLISGFSIQKEESNGNLCLFQRYLPSDLPGQPPLHKTQRLLGLIVRHLLHIKLRRIHMKDQCWDWPCVQRHRLWQTWGPQRYEPTLHGPSQNRLWQPWNSRNFDYSNSISTWNRV